MDLLNKLLVDNSSAVSSIRKRSSGKKKESPREKSEVSVCITEEEEKAESESSTIRDASMILDHSVASEEDFLIDIKRSKVRHSEVRISTSRISHHNLADYEFYESSVNILKQGFIATKFNYSNMVRK